MPRLVFLDVGHGSCAIAYAGKEAIMFDIPPGMAVLKFLRSRGIAVIRHLVVSHADKDHLGGVAAVLASGVRIDKVWVLDDQENQTQHYLHLRKAFAGARKEGNRSLGRGFPHSEQGPAIWGGLEVEWLGPNHEDRMGPGDRNSLSVVARLIQRFGKEVRGLALLPGDLTWQGFERLDKGRDWRAEWLAVPHHGGLGGSRSETVTLMDSLLDLTEAQSVFFSFGRDRYGLPIPEVVRRVRERSVRVRCSQLSRRCSEHLPQVRSQTGIVAQGAQRKPLHCCAGSVVIEAGEGPLLWHGAVDHDALVATLASPLCLGGD